MDTNVLWIPAQYKPVHAASTRCHQDLLATRPVGISANYQNVLMKAVGHGPEHHIPGAHTHEPLISAIKDYLKITKEIILPGYAHHYFFIND